MKSPKKGSLPQTLIKWDKTSRSFFTPKSLNNIPNSIQTDWNLMSYMAQMCVHSYFPVTLHQGQGQIV